MLSLCEKYVNKILPKQNKKGCNSQKANKKTVKPHISVLIIKRQDKHPF